MITAASGVVEAKQCLIVTPRSEDAREWLEDLSAAVDEADVAATTRWDDGGVLVEDADERLLVFWEGSA